MEYRNPTLRPSVEASDLGASSWKDQSGCSQKLAYVAQIILVDEVKNHIMLTAQLLLEKLSSR